jgi:nitrate reductase gamma subunit
MNAFLWGVYPYLCVLLFLVVPVLRMVYRPFGFSARSSGLFNRDILGLASLCLHWGLFLLLAGHVAGFIGGLIGAGAWIVFFYWAGLVGGIFALFGSVLALFRRHLVPEVKAMSQWDDFVVHWFLIAILGLGLYQVVFDQIFGVTYTASAWVASIARMAPQPELMASVSFISKLHIFLALTFFGLFPFTKLVHLWTFPVNYFVRPYQSMRTDRFVNQRRWEFGLTSDKSWMVYGLASVVLFFGLGSLLLGRVGGASIAAEISGSAVTGKLAGYPLYVSQCARCHGLEGRGDGPGADSPTFAQPPRDLVAGKYRFVSTTNLVASDADLVRTIRNGLVPAGMPAFGELSAEQVTSLVGVLNHLWTNRPAAGETVVVPAAPATANLQEGKALYTSMCAVCHGESGRGDGPGSAAIVDWKGHPVPARDLTSGELKAGRSPEQLYLRIKLGVPGLMPPMGAGLPPEQIWSIVRYLEASVLPKRVASW